MTFAYINLFYIYQNFHAELCFLTTVTPNDNTTFDGM